MLVSPEENAPSLAEQLAARNRELEVYQAVQQAINRQLEPERVLQMIADYARQLTGSRASTVYLLDGEFLKLAVVSGVMHSEIEIGYRMPLAHTVAGQAVRERRAMRVLDALNDPRTFKDAVQRSDVRSFLIAPLFVGDKPLGVISVANRLEGAFGDEDERILSLLAANGAICLENARLVSELAENAVQAERGRLARELHDAVTQSLFSASLIGDVLPKLWQENPAEGLRRLEELRRLTRGALAEMRTLLVELRPAALEEARLPDLLKHLCNAFSGRTQIPVDLQVDAPFILNGPVKVVFYRVAQEALNNISKHADAEHVTLRLSGDEQRTRLEVTDDGLGYDPAALSAGLGLKIMRERAESIGAQLELTSAPGQGSRLSLTWFPGGSHD